MNIIEVSTTKSKQVIDITDDVEQVIEKQKKQDGICHLFLTHTTAALSTADLDPGTDTDILDALEQVIPKLNYRHPHNPAHAPDHIRSTLIGPSLLVPFEDKKLILGSWQRVILLEFDGPRKRKVVASILATS